MHTIRHITLYIGLLFLLAACGSTAGQVGAQATVTISPAFQSQLSPIPTVPPYRCGAWASNNAPSPNANITIYARLTKDITSISGATASAVVHFRSGAQSLDQHPVSDSGGYVSFQLSLQGRQPSKIPATVDVNFTNFPGGTLQCTPAFFTPM